ncbi:MAG: DUF2169 domain-containing protein [Minicystis sp.]
MEIVTLCPFAVATMLWMPQPGEWRRTVCVKATFSLLPEQEAALAGAQEAAHPDLYWERDPQASLYAPSDFVPFKPRADILLSGHAYAPGGAPVEDLYVELGVGSLRKGLRLTGDRVWVQSPRGLVPSAPIPFARLPIRYERASRRGDKLIAGHLPKVEPALHNPVPNIEPADEQSPYATPGYGPIAPRRRALRHQLSEEVFQWTYRPATAPPPAGFDARFFNAAPLDQQVDRIEPASTIVLRHLHPRAPYLETRLPATQPRVFHLDATSGQPQEVALRCDTLWIDADRAIAVLSWRGAVAVKSPEERAAGKLLVASEAAGQELRYDDVERLAQRAGALPASARKAIEEPRVAEDVVATMAPKAIRVSEPLPFKAGPPAVAAPTPVQAPLPAGLDPGLAAALARMGGAGDVNTTMAPTRPTRAVVPFKPAAETVPPPSSTPVASTPVASVPVSSMPVVPSVNQTMTANQLAGLRGPALPFVPVPVVAPPAPPSFPRSRPSLRRSSRSCPRPTTRATRLRCLRHRCSARSRW